MFKEKKVIVFSCRTHREMRQPNRNNICLNQSLEKLPSDIICAVNTVLKAEKYTKGNKKLD